MTINKIIFCENYGTIARTLYFLEKFYNNHLVTVIILGNHDLYKYFSDINKKVLKNQIKVLYISFYQSTHHKNTLVFKIAPFIPDIFLEKRELKKLFLIGRSFLQHISLMALYTLYK